MSFLDGIPAARLSDLYALLNTELRFFAFSVAGGARSSTPSGARSCFPPRAGAFASRSGAKAFCRVKCIGSARAFSSLALMVSLFSAATASRSRLFRFHLVFGGAGGGPHGSRGFARGLGRRSTTGRGLGFFFVSPETERFLEGSRTSPEFLRVAALRAESSDAAGDGDGGAAGVPNSPGTAPVAANPRRWLAEIAGGVLAVADAAADAAGDASLFRPPVELAPETLARGPEQGDGIELHDAAAGEWKAMAAA